METLGKALLAKQWPSEITQWFLNTSQGRLLKLSPPSSSCRLPHSWRQNSHQNRLLCGTSARLFKLICLCTLEQRFKSKRSESVVTQRPPEISGSKNTLAAANITRARNASLVSGAGPDSSKGANPTQKSKFKSSGGNGPLQYVIPYSKN